MNADKLTKITDILADWHLPVWLTGFRALVRCAVVAAQHEEWGEKWDAMGVCQEVAALMGKTQWATWHNMEYALHRSKGPHSPAVAIALLVEGVTK